VFQMDQIASNVLTIPIEKNMILFSLTYLCVMFFKHPSLFGVFLQLSSTCPFHLRIDTCSLIIMLNNNFNFHTP
jgi:hypothetical protein